MPAVCVFGGISLRRDGTGRGPCRRNGGDANERVGTRRGIASMADGGLIRLEARVHDGRLGIVVENDRDEEAPSRRRNGVGLKNVRSRLEARYGKEATFRAEADEDKFRVSMSLPAEYGESK